MASGLSRLGVIYPDGAVELVYVPGRYFSARSRECSKVPDRRVELNERSATGVEPLG
jgi:hypothetical protein